MGKQSENTDGSRRERPAEFYQFLEARILGCTKGVVYGQYDPRVDDIFYVGSTIQQPGHRYSDHVHASHAYNFREAWIMAILADGSQPLFCSLYEFTEVCEFQLKHAEHAIARGLQAQGHTAICDSIPGAFPQNWNRSVSAYKVGERWSFLEQHIAEHLDLVNEQAQIVRWLREL